MPEQNEIEIVFPIEYCHDHEHFEIDFPMICQKLFCSLVVLPWLVLLVHGLICDEGLEMVIQEDMEEGLLGQVLFEVAYHC